MIATLLFFGVAWAAEPALPGPEQGPAAQRRGGRARASGRAWGHLGGSGW